MPDRITITVKLFASLQKERFVIENRSCKTGSTVGDIIKELDIAENDAAVIFINGIHADLDSLLYETDQLAIFPPIGGG